MENTLLRLLFIQRYADVNGLELIIEAIEHEWDGGLMEMQCAIAFKEDLIKIYDGDFEGNLVEYLDSDVVIQEDTFDEAIDTFANWLIGGWASRRCEFFKKENIMEAPFGTVQDAYGD